MGSSTRLRANPKTSRRASYETNTPQCENQRADPRMERMFHSWLLRSRPSTTAHDGNTMSHGEIPESCPPPSVIARRVATKQSHWPIEIAALSLAMTPGLSLRSRGQTPRVRTGMSSQSWRTDLPQDWPPRGSETGLPRRSLGVDGRRSPADGGMNMGCHNAKLFLREP